MKQQNFIRQRQIRSLYNHQMKQQNFIRQQQIRSLYNHQMKQEIFLKLVQRTWSMPRRIDIVFSTISIRLGIVLTN